MHCTDLKIEIVFCTVPQWSRITTLPYLLNPRLDHHNPLTFSVCCQLVTAPYFISIKMPSGDLDDGIAGTVEAVGGRDRLMLDDCSKTRCHNGQPCLAHLQCSTSFVLSPKYYPAMNQTISNLEGVRSKLFNENETDIFHTHHTYTFHGPLPIEQRQLRIRKYSWWFDIGENSFFFTLKSMKARLVLSEKSKARERKRLRDNEIGEVARMKLFFNIM